MIIQGDKFVNHHLTNKIYLIIITWYCKRLRDAGVVHFPMRREGAVGASFREDWMKVGIELSPRRRVGGDGCSRYRAHESRAARGIQVVPR